MRATKFIDLSLPNGYINNDAFFEIHHLQNTGPKRDVVYRTQIQGRLLWRPERFMDFMQLHGHFLLLRDPFVIPERARPEAKQLMEQAFVYYAKFLPGPNGRPEYILVKHDEDEFQPADFAQLALAEAISHPL